MEEDNDFDGLAAWLTLVFTLLGGALRAFRIGINGLHLAETFSLWLANHSIADMLPLILKIDQHPPLYYLLLHYWTGIIGITPYDIRLLSVLFGSATIPIIFLIGKRLSGPVVGLAAAVFLALSPVNIRFAQETRMYTLLTFNAAVAIYALARLLTDSRTLKPIGSQFLDYLRLRRNPSLAQPDNESAFSYEVMPAKLSGWRARLFGQRWPPIQAIETDLAWVGFIVFSAATLYSDNMAVLFFLATNIFVFGLILFQRMKKPGSQPAFQAPSLWNWVKAQVAIILLWSPWIAGFAQQAGRVYQEFLIPKPDLGTVSQVISSYLNAFMPGQATEAIIFWILYAVVLTFGFVYYLKRLPRFLFLAALLAIPFLGELIVSIRQPIFSDRTLLWTTVPLFLLLAAGIAQLRFRLLIIVVLGILAVNNLFSAGDFFRFMPREDWSDVAGYVAKYAEKDDLILFNATWVQIPFDYTFTVYEHQYRLEVAKHGVPVDLFNSGIPEPRMTESDIPMLNALLRGHDRVWLVYTHNAYTDPLGLITQTLSAEMKVMQERDFNLVGVRLFETP